MQAAAVRPAVDFIFVNQGKTKRMLRRHSEERALPVA